MRPDSLSLLIPAYNEELRIKPFLADILKYQAIFPERIFEIIIIDDGSADKTIAVTKSFSKKLPIRILSHKTNQGKGAAIQTGVKAAKGNIIVFIDADGATPITELDKMIRTLQSSDIAIGNRWLPGSKTERHSTLRRLSGWTYRRYMSLFGLGKIDTMCGFKGYHKKVAQHLFTGLIAKRWLFDTEIAYKAVQAGYTITNFPIDWESKDGSKLDSKTLIKSALQIWPLIRKIKKLSAKPIK